MPEIKEKYDKLKYNKKWDAENCKKVTIKCEKPTMRFLINTLQIMDSQRMDIL